MTTIKIGGFDVECKIVWSDSVQVRSHLERRLAISESLTSCGPMYVVLASLCAPGADEIPEWSRRCDPKFSYDDARRIAGKLYEWDCDYARSKGFIPPCDLL